MYFRHQTDLVQFMRKDKQVREEKKALKKSHTT